MIELILEDYCQEGCRMFKAHVTDPSFTKCTKDIFIKCEWAAQCRYLRNYLKRTEEEHEEKTDKETEGTDY